MSKEGIKLMAKVFSFMQETRGELFRLANKTSKGGFDLVDTQDIILAQLLDTGKDAMKWRFAEITLGKITVGSLEDVAKTMEGIVGISQDTIMAGKRVGGSFYVQASAISNGRSLITPKEKERYNKAATPLYGHGLFASSIICIEKDKIRFLRMDLQLAHPYVKSSIIVYNDGKTRNGCLNKQIYHRMNTILDPSDPTYRFHCRVTEYEESIGALGPFKVGGKYPSGHLNTWIKQLKSKGISYNDLMAKITEMRDA